MTPAGRDDEGAWQGWRDRIQAERKMLKDVEDRLASPSQSAGEHDPETPREELDSYVHMVRDSAEMLHDVADSIEEYRTEHFPD